MRRVPSAKSLALDGMSLGARRRAIFTVLRTPIERLLELDRL